MELLDYSGNAGFNLKSSSESEEEYQIMSTYFHSQASDNDSSYTNDTDYEYKQPMALVSGSGSGSAVSSAVSLVPSHQPAPISSTLATTHSHGHTHTHSHGHPHIHSYTQPEYSYGQAFDDESSISVPNSAVVPTVPMMDLYSSSLLVKSSQQPPLFPTSFYPEDPRPLPIAAAAAAGASGGASANTPVVNPVQTPSLRHQPSPPQSTPTSQQTPSIQTTSTPASLPISSPQLNMHEYPDMTTMVNSNSSMVVPMVDSTFVDLHICTICSKRITRDMSRHMRTHQIIPRFSCTFPKSQCNHKSGRFNRPYDFKKHLLNRHFKFDIPDIKRIHNLSDKLDHTGSCPCGLRFVGKDWLDFHILTPDRSKRCPCIEVSA
ncbi:hypothetical protein CAAN1_01S07382 [[Candida] anglica]|uniref:C2H2-type domain-containing protein n=1 Tax=[Candida] anglica TaxID=148631 RepID=A0ABP0ELX5_9ASCO